MISSAASTEWLVGVRAKGSFRAVSLPRVELAVGRSADAPTLTAHALADTAPLLHLHNDAL